MDTVNHGTVLVVDDILANRNLLRDTLEPAGYEVLLAPDGETALKVCHRARPDVILLDVMMPRMDGFETCRRLKQHEETRNLPVIFITARDETQSMVEGFCAGGVDYVAKPFQAEEVLARLKTHLENSRLTKMVTQQYAELAAANELLRQEIARRERAKESFQTADRQLSLITQIEAERWGIPSLVGISPAMATVIKDVRKLQPLPSTSVLIIGESGTGKELVARAVHFGSPRAKRPFLPVNCAAIPSELAEFLLFGHAKGSFSGAATDKKGCFENADGGTLFLDEIGDLPINLQPKLLRVLESGRILPLGAAREIEVDVRVLAATNADLPSEIGAGRFRQDLYFRLARFVADVPPLRDRREDIPVLVEHFLGVIARDMGFAKPRLSAEALSMLEAYDYPGNIRELKNLIERALGAVPAPVRRVIQQRLALMAFSWDHLVRWRIKLRFGSGWSAANFFASESEFACLAEWIPLTSERSGKNQKGGYMPKLITRVVSCLMAAGLLTAIGATTMLRAQTTDKPSRINPAETEKKSVRLPFRGKINSVDKSAKTITLEGKQKKRVIHVTPQTRIAKAGKTATLDDAVIGEEVGGQALRLSNGREEAISLRLGPKPEANTTPAGKPASANDPGTSPGS